MPVSYTHLVTKRYTIAYKGLKPGLHDFRFEADGSLFEEFESPEIKDGACEVTVALERGEAMLTLDVTVDGSVVVECDRCLEECRIPVHLSLIHIFLTSEYTVLFDAATATI